MKRTYLAPYGQSLALHTDLYQLTMAYGYWKKQIHEREAVFQLFFRRKPFGGTFALAAGLETAIKYIKALSFDSSDLAYLESLEGAGGRPLFEPGFLEYLSTLKITCDLDAVPEGTPMFPQEPLVRVQGPLLQAQMLESALLNIINFQTLIATKAARVMLAVKGDPVVEFGLRRAQGIDGALSAARAAFIGGCMGTSNVLAGKLLGIPVKGTFAHSWVMVFHSEEEAFNVFAEVLPESCIFLVDTYDTILGVHKAVRTAKKLREGGVEMLGVRIDSGDLAHLSIEIRKILDEAGFKDAKIMASNELDEHLIRDLKHQGAKIDFWGVGTHLVTGKDQPAFDGVYKLSALQDEKGEWLHKLKISEQIAKITNPGILQVRRFERQDQYSADMIYDTLGGIQQAARIVDPTDPALVRTVSKESSYRDLLEPVLRKGAEVKPMPKLSSIQQYAQRELSKFHPAIRRFLNPQMYLAGLEKSLFDRKVQLIENIQDRGDF